MTIQQFLSPSVGEWIKYINEKYPHMSAKEFRELFEKWFEENEESIVLNESVDMSKYSKIKLNEGDDYGSFDDEEDEEETSDEVKDEEETDTIEKDDEGSKESVDDEYGSFDGGDEEDEFDEDGYRIFKDVEGGDAEIKEKPISITPRVLSDSEASKLTSKIKGKYIVNNGDDYEHNIFNVVNAWYDVCVLEGKGENLQEHNRITLLDTGVVEDMRALFAFANVPNLDLSEWDTSAVLNMEGMFYKSTFNSSSIEDWDVSMCHNFRNMFQNCRFSGDISRWSPGKVERLKYDEVTGRVKRRDKIDRVTGKVVMAKDEFGHEYPVTEPDTEWVPAELPIVGSRTSDVNDVKKKRMLAELGRLDAALKDEEEKKIKKGLKENYDMKNIVDFDTFINEGFVDKIKYGIDKVKDVIKNACAKINGYYITFFKNDGSLYGATSKFTTLNYIADGNVPGVAAFSGTDSELLNSNVKSEATIADSNERYGYIKKDSVEYQNYKTLIEYLSSTNESFNVVDAEELNEYHKMPLSSKGTGIDGVADIGSDRLKQLIKSTLREAPAYKRETGTLLIFGAPGIGKTTIPKEIIRAYNDENPERKKALITVECGELTLDGFYLPMPEFKSMEDKISENPDVIDKLGINPESVERFKKKRKRESVETVKSWLPVYPTQSNADDEIMENAIANGRRVESTVWDEKRDEYIPTVENTTEGGIIMFDEFLRADPEIFKILMQIFSTRRIGQGQKFGSKWAFICCSNRPVDDREVSDHYENLSVAAGTRWLKGIYNFVPDFNDWKEWAETEGKFDEYTIEFLSQTKDGNREEVDVIGYDGKHTKSITYKHWHNVDLDDRTVIARPIPRTWAALMTQINDEIIDRGVDSILDLPNDWIRSTANGIIGKETGDKYANFLSSLKREGGVKVKDLFFTDGSTGSYAIDTMAFPCAETSKRVLDFINARYYRKDGDVKLPSTKEMWNMTVNMDRNYKKNDGSHLKSMHMQIINTIFKIRSKDTEIIKKLKQYINIVHKLYPSITYADDKPISEV